VRENVGDVLVEKIIQRKTKVTDLISRQYKSTRPFASRKLSTEEQLWAIDNLGFEDMQELRQEYGDEALNDLLFRIHKLRGV